MVYLFLIKNLSTWLNHLSDIAEYKSQRDLQKAIVNKILEYLELADKDNAFREVLYAFIDVTLPICGDKVALSVLDLGIFHQLATMDLEDTKALADFLIKGPWTIKLLKQFSIVKISDLRCLDKKNNPYMSEEDLIKKVDEIEVCFALITQLKQELNIPIHVQEMLFLRLSRLTKEDFQEAKDFVLGRAKY